jgi:hypothetical protein
LQAPSALVSQNILHDFTADYLIRKLSAIEVLSRSVDELHHFTENALVADSSDATAAEAIVFLDDLNPNASKGQRRLTDELIAIVENSLGVKARRISLEAEWSAHPPEDGKGKLLQDYLGEVCLM